ncbi:MAG: VWA domain-containing protein [Phycisphaeraceae bacterium]|nr:VWA domain-containing protein [Phycisphaerales bacterium]MCB9860520.1 VWA domain-containing protein [Phycisphaeraceae bacterium]
MKNRFVTLCCAFLGLCALGVLTNCGNTSYQSNGGYTTHAQSDASVRNGFTLMEKAPPSKPGSIFAATIGQTISVSADEEIWVIQRPVIDPNSSQDDTPGCGSMMCIVNTNTTNEIVEVPVPLKHTSVSANVTGWIASVDVTQQFHNPFDETIEAVYLFPLPVSAAINEFVMTIGDRHIRGIIREREEAEQVYEAAKAAGHTASLLNQQRPNIFEQKVANIEPGKQIDIDITYFHTLTWSDGWFEFVFPMVVGPRFNPPGFTDGIGAVARGSTGSSQKNTIEYLRPNERSGHDINVSVSIDAGVSIETIESLSHVIRVKHDQNRPEHAAIELSENDRVPNKDFVLRYKVAGDAIKSVLLAQQDNDGQGGYFMLMLVPPDSLRGLERAPVEMVFVLDSSGSMQGAPIEQARRAINRGLMLLEPSDAFQIVNFSDTASPFGPRSLDASAENIKLGQQHISNVTSGGGTMMMNGIKTALGFPSDPQRLRFVTFLTDGFIGNEQQVMRAVHDQLGPARVFSFGVGQAPNRFLMEGMARAGRGAVAYLSLDDSSNRVMDTFFEAISHPALTDVQAYYSPGAQVREVYPQNIPDLFVGRPVILTGRYDGTIENSVTITGKTGNQNVSLTVPVQSFDENASNGNTSALSTVWARMKIADLMRQMWLYGEDTSNQVRMTALTHGLMSEFTSYVAVDSLSQTEGTAKTVNVPVLVPDGTTFETTVGQGG